MGVKQSEERHKNEWKEGDDNSNARLFAFCYMFAVDDFFFLFLLWRFIMATLPGDNLLVGKGEGSGGKLFDDEDP